MPYQLFVIVLCLMAPAMQMLQGWLMRKKPNREINDNFGYHSKRAKRSKAAWEYAQARCGKLWWVVGWASLIVSIAALFFILNGESAVLGIGITVLIIAQAAAILATLAIVEAELQRKFPSAD